MTIIIDRTVWVLREDYDALKADNERLAAIVSEIPKSRRSLIDDAISQRQQLAYVVADRERLRRDAERYRWICRFPEDADYAITHALNGCSRPGSVDGPSFRDLLSDAIDAALSATNEEPPQ